MKIVLAFDNSGDSITFDAVNQQVAEYYIHELNLRSLNSFRVESPTLIKNKIEQLQRTVANVNEFIGDLIDVGFPTLSTSEALNQSTLNSLHEQWAKIQSLVYDVKARRNSENKAAAAFAEQIFHQSSDDEMMPSLGSVLHKLNLEPQYSRINADLHSVEVAITQNCKFITDRWVEIPNTFDKECVTNDHFHLILPFNHLGRTLQNKFWYYDSSLEFDDENTFNELLGVVEVRLQRKETLSYSVEYIEWCKSHNRVPTGNQLNIGLLPDIDNKLTDYRLLLYRNIVENNKFSLHIR